MRHFLSIDNLTAGSALALLDRASDLQGGAPPALACAGRIIALAFFEPSTRTRVGFAVAAARVGSVAIDAQEPKFTLDMSAPESVADMARVISGMVDTIVLRDANEAAHQAFVQSAVCPVINAGNGRREHPTQTLVDLFAIRRALGRLEGLRVGIVGDGGARAAHSLVRALRWLNPVEVRLMCPPGRDLESSWTEGLPISICQSLDFTDLDVLYVVGLAPSRGPGHLEAAQRAEWAIGSAALKMLPEKAIILCPLPRIDEIALAVDRDVRARYFAQSDDAVWVRASLLEHLLTDGG